MTSFGFQTTGIEVVKHFKSQAQGKTVVITGASAEGLGAETALSLAHADLAQLFLLARSITKVQPLIDEIKKINSGIAVHFVSIELDKRSTIEAAAQDINSRVSKIDVLINNAGIMAVPYSKNDTGVESQFAVNHIGHFLLTNLLLAKIRAAGKGARVVNLSSDGYKLGPFRFDDWNFSDGKTYDEWSGYGQAKTANILFTRYLAKQLAKDGIYSYAVHPGVIYGTGLTNGLDMSIFAKASEIALRNTGEPFTMDQPKSKQQGVATTVVASLDPELGAKSGSYLVDCNVAEIREYAASEENAEKLWKLSEEILGQTFIL